MPRLPLGDIDDIAKCGDEADRLVPEVGERSLCLADTWEQRLDCARSSDCDPELCTIESCPSVSDEAEQAWNRAIMECGWELVAED